jgi:hypothetical protein
MLTTCPERRFLISGMMVSISFTAFAPATAIELT